MTADGHRSGAAARVDTLADRLTALESVDAVRLVGSRARGDATALSDWDFEVDTTDFPATAAAVPGAVSLLQPLAAFWDPLGNRPNFVVVLDGPVKVDVIFDGQPFTRSPPWTPTPDTVAAIDAHFWDWTLWLGAKQLRGERDLVRRELDRLHEHLLGPLGVPVPPTDLDAAIEAYLDARELHEARCDIRVDRELGRQVRHALATQG